MNNDYQPKVGDKVRVLTSVSHLDNKIDVDVPHVIEDLYCSGGTIAVTRLDREEFAGMYSWLVMPEQIESWVDEIPAPSPYRDLGTQIGALVDEKQRQYGNSFGKCGDFLRLLYPDGIAPDAYGDMLALVRIFDKQVRIANGGHGDNESPYRDIAGYGLLGEMEAVKKGGDASETMKRRLRIKFRRAAIGSRCPARIKSRL